MNAIAEKQEDCFITVANRREKLLVCLWGNNQFNRVLAEPVLYQACILC